MRFSTIPKTDLHASVICLGTADLGGSVSETDSLRLYDEYVSLEGNFVDTANVYADWLNGEKSTSEKTIARWLKSRGNRSKLIIATKGAHPDLKAYHIPRLQPADIIHDAEQSLRHLQIDTIDLYYLHRDDPNTPVEIIVDTLQKLVDAGKIRYYACSNWKTERIEAAQSYAQSRGWIGFVCNQMLWNLAAMRPGAIGDPTIAAMDDGMLAYHERTGMAVAPFSSQANGFFGGKYKRGQEPPTGGASNSVKANYFSDANFDRLERTQEIAAQLGCTSSQVALAYLTAQPFPVFPIVGPKTLEQLRDSCGAGDITLDAETARYVRDGQ